MSDTMSNIVNDHRQGQVQIKFIFSASFHFLFLNSMMNRGTNFLNTLYMYSNLYFQELMLAMQWARLNNVPFPDIDPTVVDREGLKECYIFENPNDPRCPIVMHFVLVNITFRDEKAPGIYTVCLI